MAVLPFGRSRMISDVPAFGSWGASIPPKIPIASSARTQRRAEREQRTADREGQRDVRREHELARAESLHEYEARAVPDVDELDDDQARERAARTQQRRGDDVRRRIRQHMTHEEEALA